MSLQKEIEKKTKELAQLKEQQLKAMMAKAAKTKKTNKQKAGGQVDVYGSDDYCGLTTNEYAFYLGYEQTYCNTHNIINCELEDEDFEEECDKERIFEAADKDGNVIARYKDSELDGDNIEDRLLFGIGRWLNEKRFITN